MPVRACAARRTSLALAGVLAACAWGEVGLPPVEDPIAVQAILNAGSARQVIWIERGFTPEERIHYRPDPRRPLAAPPSRIEVREIGGPAHGFQPDPADPTRFVADFTPVPGGRYELLIDADGRAIRGTTVVPHAVVISEPAADTVDLTPEGLRVAWEGGSATDFAWHMSPADTAGDPFFFPFLRWVQSATAIVLPRSGFYWYRPETVVWVLAADATTARLYDLPRPGEETQRFAGNLDGAVGLFGAMTWDRFYVRVPP